MAGLVHSRNYNKMYMYDNSACSVADGCTRRPTREATASAVPWRCPYACMKFGIHVVLSVNVSWLSAFKMNTIEISWSVKGYRYFKVKPNPGEVKQVCREYNNPVDPNAMSVFRYAPPSLDKTQSIVFQVLV